MGDSGQGPLLPNQVQGVKKGAGVYIGTDGTISFEASSAIGVVKTNNNSAYNSYVWPNAAPPTNSFLVANASGGQINLEWDPVPVYGLGLNYTTPNLKVGIPVADNNSQIPAAGTNALGAVRGSLYWNSEYKRLYVYNGTWEPTSYGPDSLTIALLTGNHHLFVNPEIGSDYYISGEYVEPGEDPVPAQQAKYGYTPQKPFRTIQRAAIEAARIQNGSGFSPLFYDRIVIHCSAGEHIVYNDFGSLSVTIWEDETVPTNTQLSDMNSSTYAGVILPRGVSVVGEDYRKTIIRPSYVPEKTGNIETDRASIFRVTGGSFFFGFTFKDKLGSTNSHHLLDCFSFVSELELEDYYDKIRTIFQEVNPIYVANPGETEIVAPQPPINPTQSTDGVIGSSPYIFNCSIRSDYGLCGVNADGNQVTGFRSMVIAQFTGVSLQKDPSCWEFYDHDDDEWKVITNYNSYIAISPNDVRMRPSRRNFHIRAVNNAFIQEVSVFAIGQGVHHWTHSGGEISITNSNSTFGGCAAIAEGYKSVAFKKDTGWDVSYINVATDLTEDINNVNRIYLGRTIPTLSNTATEIVLEVPLVDSELTPGIPEKLARFGYTFTPDSYLWVENPYGYDFRAQLTSFAWDPAIPNQISVQAEMVTQPPDNTSPGGTSPTGVVYPDLGGRQVYIRRLVDVRPESRRKYSLDLSTDNLTLRAPLRDYVFQTTPGSGSITETIPDSSLLLTNASSSIPPGNFPLLKRVNIVLERGNPDSEWVSGDYYRKGDTVRKDNKHYTCILQNTDAVFDPSHWSESYVQMASDYNAYDFPGNTAPIIIFDDDTDGDDVTTNCGYNLTTVWSDPASPIGLQYTSATDYRGVYQFLIAIGFTEEETFNILLPTTNQLRKLNPADPSDMKDYTPGSGGVASGLDNWAVEFRRPSLIRLFSHSWEWAGFLNYTKALPPYQGDLSPQNQFNYYFTNSMGGKVYATGYNQEGYLITPAGITDLTTNTTTGVADIGSQDQGAFPNSFDSLTVNNLTVNVSMSGSPTFSPEFYENLLQSGLGIDNFGPFSKLSVPVGSAPPPTNSTATGAKEGSLYWDNSLGVLFILYDDGNSTQWVQAVPSGSGGGGGGISQVIISSTPPATTLNAGTLYWNSVSETLFVLYDDGVTKSWVEASPNNNAEVIIDSTPPATTYDAGTLYWNSTSETLFVLYDDGVTKQWVESNPPLPIDIQVSATPPSTRSNGDPLQAGDLYFNSSVNKYYNWDGAAWVSVASPAYDPEGWFGHSCAC
jgi:hypothetical protein